MICFFTMVGYKGKRTHRIIRQWFLHQKITKNLITILCQLVLLALTTMVLKRQDDRVVGSNEGGVSQSVDDIFEQDVGTHGLAVGDDWLLVLTFSIPAVQLHTPTTKHGSDSCSNNTIVNTGRGKLLAQLIGLQFTIQDCTMYGRPKIKIQVLTIDNRPYPKI